MALTRATWPLDRRPCFVCAAAARALPSGVRGPVDLPPCNRHLVFPLSAAFWQGVPRRVLARQRLPGQSGSKRVALPTSISGLWLTLVNRKKLIEAGCGARLGGHWPGQRCLAKTRQGTPCQNPVVTDRSRCQLSLRFYLSGVLRVHCRV
jgi:hypothetical protein